MKNSKAGLFAILFVLALFAGACTLKAQSAVNPAPKPNCEVLADGNYQSIPKAATYVDTGKTYVDLATGIRHKVYETISSKKRFYFRKSEQTGKEYRQYLNPTL